MSGNVSAKDASGATFTVGTDRIATVDYFIEKSAWGADGAIQFTADTNAARLPVGGSAIGNPDDAAAASDAATSGLIGLLKRLLGKVPPVGAAAAAASLPVTIASNQSDVPVVPGNGAASTYSVAGVIAINTVLLTIDCQNRRSVSIQCASMGTTGVVTPEWSNDNATWVAATIFTPAGASATTFNAAGLWGVDVRARYLRLRLSTATTAGTTTLAVLAMNHPLQSWFATQPVSGTVTANIGTGSLAAGTNAIGDVGTQYRANATGAGTIANVVSAATTNATNVKASAGRLLGIYLCNTNAAVRYMKLHNSATAPTAGAGVVATIPLPPNQPVWVQMEGGMAFSSGIGYTLVTGSATTDATAVAAGEITGTLVYA